MTQSPQSRGPTFLAVTAGSLFAATAAHAGTPMTFLRSFGKPADAILPLTWGMMIISIVVVVVITGLLIFGLLGARRYSNMAPRSAKLGPAGGGLAWLYIGVGVSTVVLFAVRPPGPW